MTHNRICPHSTSPAYTRSDLCAQLAPLNSYGLNGLSSALVDGLKALASLSRSALSGAGRASEERGRQVEVN